jgi:hypothetical protein
VYVLRANICLTTSKGEASIRVESEYTTHNW